MRKLICLALALLLALPFSALAAEGDGLVARQGTDGFGDRITALCAESDTLWLLGESGVYRCDAPSRAIVSFPFDEAWMSGRAVYDPAREAAVFREIAAWFCREGGPWALIQERTEREIIDVYAARVALGDRASLEPMGSVDWRPLDATGKIAVESCAAVGGVLCAVMGGGESGELALIPLDGSPAALTGVEGRGLCLYGDGVALIREDWDSDEAVVTAFDPRTRTARSLFRRNIETGLGALAQEPDSGRLLACSEGWLIALDPETGEEERVAPVSVAPIQQGGIAAAALPSGLWAACAAEGVVLRRARDRADGGAVLNVDELIWLPPLAEAALDLEQADPDIAVASGYEEDVIRVLLTRSEEYDVIVGPSDEKGLALREALARGWCAPLDSAVLADYVGGMYPGLKDLLMEDGRALAVPLTARADGLSVNLSALAALGLTPEDVPGNWPDFFDFLGSVGGGDAPVVFGYGAEWLLRALFRDAALEIEAGNLAGYDAPDMLAALEAFSRVDWETLGREGDALMGRAPALINVSDDAGVGAGRLTAQDGRLPLRLSLTREGEAAMPVSCCVAFVNPASGHIAEAVALLEAAAERVNHAHRATLSPEYGQPEFDTAAWQRACDEADREIESLEARAGAGDAAAGSALSAARDERDRLIQRFTVISRDSLDWYRAHDGRVTLAMSCELDDIDFDALLSQYLERGDLEGLARETEKKAAMRRLER